jgi:hypothetical protein
MMTLSRSTVRIRSRITRYWLSGVSSESRNFAHSPSQAFLAAATSSFSEASALPPPPLLAADLHDQASIASAASPITAWSTGSSLSAAGIARSDDRLSAARRAERRRVRLSRWRAPDRPAPCLGNIFGASGRGAEQRMASVALAQGDHRRRNELRQRRERGARLGVGTRPAHAGIFRRQRHAHRLLTIGRERRADQYRHVSELALVFSLPDRPDPIFRAALAAAVAW